MPTHKNSSVNDRVTCNKALYVPKVVDIPVRPTARHVVPLSLMIVGVTVTLTKSLTTHPREKVLDPLGTEDLYELRVRVSVLAKGSRKCVRHFSSKVNNVLTSSFTLPDQDVAWQA